MTDEQFEQIRASQRRIEANLRWMYFLVLMIFALTVIAPILQQFGLYNLMGVGE